MGTTRLRPVFGCEEFAGDDEGALVPSGVVAKGKRVRRLLLVGSEGKVIREDRREEGCILSNRRLIACSGSRLFRRL